ncbi:PD-(D/E)XK nuclease family protein [Myxococcus xanthus]|uniref:PD-(D/E)XK nuclease family protein n=1 Tax=Myxococcus xanthus TaxID=34 RepID=UPI0019176117|nr:PD-(D/E)XK nuclease family protein [Myxococcus xanthus]QQR41609.1 PD-(D/E)XK nuclease family protein [Myxococcus xanthus]
MHAHFIESVQERDIDLLLLEELNVSPEFAEWFATQASAGALSSGGTGRCSHSVSDVTLGESDLVLEIEQVDGQVTAILIENKVDAPPQPAQGARYRKRGARGVQEGRWADFKTCLVAPQRYLECSTDAQSYDACISYEVMAAWMAQHVSDAVRGAYRARMLREGIEQNRRGYTLKPDNRVTAFWLGYWEYAASKHPELEMPDPGLKPAGSDWPAFRPSGVNRRFVVVHKLGRGDVDLQVSDGAKVFSHLKEKWGPSLDADMQMVLAGKSAAIRLRAPSVNGAGDFAAQRAQVADGLAAAARLVQLARALQQDFDVDALVSAGGVGDMPQR